MAKIAFLHAKKEVEGLKLFDIAGNEFQLPTAQEFLQRIEHCATSSVKCIRVAKVTDGLGYFPAIEAKANFQPVTAENFPELWVTKLNGPVTVGDEQKAQSSEPVVMNIRQKLEELVKAKPKKLKIKDLKWKFLVRCALKGRNILMVGDHGAGKTFAAYCLARVLPEQEFFTFNLGATQDPRGELVGNTFFDKVEGTIFKQSRFVRAITTPGAIILLDELSRAHPDAWNILMTVLDPDQRYLSVSEDPDIPVVQVAQGVSFIATANRGIKYTSTRAVDAALNDRFTLIEFDLMSKDDMMDLLMITSPNGSRRNAAAIAGIYDTIVVNYESDEGKVENILSTRQCIEAMDMMQSGFTLEEVAETTMYPFFDKDGGNDSERTFVQMTVQKYVPATQVMTDEFDSDVPFEGLDEAKPF